MAFLTATTVMFNSNISEQYNNNGDGQWTEEVAQQQQTRQAVLAEDGQKHVQQQMPQQQNAATTTTMTTSSSCNTTIGNSCNSYSTGYSSNNGIVWPGVSSSNKCCRGGDAQRRQHNNRYSNRQTLSAMPTTTMALTGARRWALVLVIVLAQLSNSAMVAGLTCYETVNGKTTIVQNDSWTYCALVPATIVGKELVNGSQFGLGPDNDMMATYNSAFAMSADEYRILTVCIYERYDFSRFLTIKPDLAVEFAFRCVCNYDLCNSEPTFSAYLSAIKSESFARR